MFVVVCILDTCRTNPTQSKIIKKIRQIIFSIVCVDVKLINREVELALT